MRRLLSITTSNVRHLGDARRTHVHCVNMAYVYNVGRPLPDTQVPDAIWSQQDQDNNGVQSERRLDHFNSCLSAAGCDGTQ